MKLFVAILLVFVFTLEAKVVTRTKVMMGTFATVKLEKQDKRHFKNVYKTLKRVENSLSSYDPISPIYRLNHNKKAKINLYTYEALSFSEKYYKQSNGYFNIAIGSITKDLYRFGEEERVPKSKELKKSVTSFSSLAFDENIAKIGKGIKIDLGGMGKGYGVDRAIEYLKINGISRGSVALSGDIRCLDRCKIEVNNPFDNKPLVYFYTKYPDMGVSTSGNYNRYVKEKKHNHLINPKTKKSGLTFTSITLISTLPNSDLDAYATAASVMPRREAYKFLDSLALAYIILEENMSFHMSKNLSEYISLKKDTSE